MPTKFLLLSRNCAKLNFGAAKERKNPMEVKIGRNMLHVLPNKKTLEDGGYLSDDELADLIAKFSSEAVIHDTPGSDEMKTQEEEGLELEKKNDDEGEVLGMEKNKVFEEEGFEVSNKKEDITPKKDADVTAKVAAEGMYEDTNSLANLEENTPLSAIGGSQVAIDLTND